MITVAITVQITAAITVQVFCGFDCLCEYHQSYRVLIITAGIDRHSHCYRHFRCTKRLSLSVSVLRCYWIFIKLLFVFLLTLGWPAKHCYRLQARCQTRSCRLGRLREGKQHANS
jgi:hypothetical protein